MVGKPQMLNILELRHEAEKAVKCLQRFIRNKQKKLKVKQFGAQLQEQTHKNEEIEENTDVCNKPGGNLRKTDHFNKTTTEALGILDQII